MADLFDLDGARKAGYSDDEIADHLGSNRNFDVAGARSAGYSSQEIINHLTSSITPTYTGSSAAVAGGSTPTDLPWWKRATGAALEFVPNVVGGVGAEALRTATLGGRLAPSTPFWQESLTTPPGLAAKAGSTGMTAAEFMLPSGVVSRGVRAAEIASAGTRAARVLPWATRALGEAASAGAVETARTGDIQKGKQMAELGGAMAAGAPVLGPVSKYLTDWAGKISGQGGEVLRTIASNATQELKDAMRNKISENEIVQSVRDAAHRLMEQRAARYTRALDALDPAAKVAPIAKDQIVSELQNYGGQVVQKAGKPVNTGVLDATGNPVMRPGAPTEEISFKGSRVGQPPSSGDAAQVQSAYDIIKNWKDFSIRGMDQLKQTIYDYAGKVDARVAPLFYRLGETARDNLAKASPDYAKMTAEYAKDSEYLKAVTSELSIGAKSPGATIRKLATALNQNNDYRKRLVESLDAATGSDIKSLIAGYASRTDIPRGLFGSFLASAIGMGGVAFHEPRAFAAILPTMLLTNPRAMGELMAMISAVRKAVPGSAARAAGVGLAAPPASLLAPPNTPQR